MAPRRGKIGLLAASFTGGVALAGATPAVAAWPWAALCAAGLVAAAAAAGLPRGALAALCIAAVGLGAARYEVRMHRVRPDHLAAAGLGDGPALVRVRGTVLTAPDTVRRRGSLAAFYRRDPASLFAIDVHAAVLPGGAGTPRTGRLAVHVKGAAPPVRPGQAVEVTGILLGPRPPRNPGQFDEVRHARALGEAGLLSVPRAELVTVVPDARAPPGPLAAQLGPALRARARDLVLRDLPAPPRPPRAALLEALLLGTRGPDFDALGASVRRVGLAHVVAISGMHLGVLAGFVLVAARLAGAGPRAQAGLVIATIGAYLLLVEVRMPVLRAATMLAAASLGLAAGRRYPVGNLLALSCAGLLWWRPSELASPGFQLSFGVVLGLVHLGPVLRRRWFGPPDLLTRSAGHVGAEWLRTTWTASVVAWAVATPITAHHWGQLWPLAPPLSVAALPLVAVVLAAGYAKIAITGALGDLVPAVSEALGAVVGLAADVTIALIDAAGTLGVASIAVPAPSPAWSAAALAWVVAWVVLGLRGRVPVELALALGARRLAAGRRALVAGGIALVAWLAWPAMAGVGAALRVDVLAVGDGSCYLVRSGRGAVLFDAGSAGMPDAGDDIIVPALRRLGVHGLDAVVVSHPNLDHYSALLEVAGAFAVERALVTAPFLDAAAREPAVSQVLDGLAAHGVDIETVAAGDERVLGAARWCWLHPARGDAFERANDGSMVVHVQAAGGSLLLTGDIERRGLARWRGRADPPRAEVLELPHHGAHHPAAARLVGDVAPRVVIQSAGPRGRERAAARWSRALAGTRWLVTARDGACAITIEPDGEIRVETYAR